MSDFLSNPEEVKEYAPRFRLLYGVLMAAVVLFVLRLWYLQVISGTELREFSERNRLKENDLPAPRGMIFDRTGHILVDNQPGFVATITPQYAQNLEEVAEVIGKIIDQQPAGIIAKVKQSKFRNGAFFPVHIKENLTPEEVARLERIKLDYPGLDIQMAILRSYRSLKNGAQLFGYVGEISKDELAKLNRDRKPEDKFKQGQTLGKSGIEQVYDNQLRGADGLAFQQVDAHGREMATQSLAILEGVAATEPRPGHNMILTIDKDVQDAAFKALHENGKIGAAVALDPNSGEVLAWVNAPSFDPNEFAAGIAPKTWADLVNDQFKPLRNRVIQNHHPPGSTFKTLVALAALQEKVITTETKFFCKGSLHFGRRDYHCWMKHGHGDVNIFQAIERSCDVFFYRLGITLGIDKIAKYASLLGLGTKTGIELLGEVPGLVPTSEWKKRAIGEEWQPGENLSNAIGQGFVLTTPLQMALAYGTIGMEGPLFRPYVVKQMTDTDDKVIYEAKPQMIRDTSQAISHDTFRIIKEGLRLVGNGSHGTAASYRIPGVEIAGKTGTVQLFSLSADQVFAKCENRPLKQRHHGWFVGYAPADKPLIAAAVLAEHSCHGASGAAPVVRDMILAFLQKYHPDLIKKSPVPIRAVPVEDE